MRQERNEPAGKRRIALYKSDPKQQRPSKHSPGQTKTDEGGCKKKHKTGRYVMWRKWLFRIISGCVIGLSRDTNTNATITILPRPEGIVKHSYNIGFGHCSSSVTQHEKYFIAPCLVFNTRSPVWATKYRHNENIAKYINPLKAFFSPFTSSSFSSFVPEERIRIWC